MTGRPFTLEIVTPQRRLRREIMHIRLMDDSGYFGVMRGHTDFITVVVTSLAQYTGSDGRDVYLAVDGGLLHIRGRAATLTAREVYESEDPDALADIIEGDIAKRQETEASFRDTLRSLERQFVLKTSEYERGA